MTTIKVICPDCHKEIQIRIRTIDSLLEEIAALKEQLKEKESLGLFNKLFGGQ